MKLNWQDGSGYVSWVTTEGAVGKLDVYPPVLSATEFPDRKGFIIVHSIAGQDRGPKDNAIAYDWGGKRLYVVKYPDQNVNAAFLWCVVEGDKILLGSTASVAFLVEPTTGQIISRRQIW